MSGVFTPDQASGAVAAIRSVTRDGLKMNIINMTAEGDRVCAEVRSEAELTTGQTYHNLYHFLFILRDQKFVCVKEFLDTKMVEDNFKPAWDAREPQAASS